MVGIKDEICIWGFNFFPLDASAQKFFGFSEFLAGLALMILAWTIGDVRYRFRVRSAPIPLVPITFGVVASIGLLTLLTDLWRAAEWYVPEGRVLSPSAWQALLGLVFLLVFLAWAWFAFIAPQKFGRFNAKRYALTLYGYVVRGAPSELAVIADELRFSVPALIDHAARMRRSPRQDDQKSTRPKAPEYAWDLLLLIADRRLCKAMVESSSVTALLLFQRMQEMHSFYVPVGAFARNIVNEAIANKDSFLYHEAEGYRSGLLGYQKPLSQALFSNYSMVERVGTILEPDVWAKRKWDADQWEAYCSAVLMTFKNYVAEHLGSHSTALARAHAYIQDAASDIYKLNGATLAWEDDAYARLRISVGYVGNAIDVLNEKAIPDHVVRRLRGKEKNDFRLETIYDDIAKMIVELFLIAANFRTPQWDCWVVQHNTTWSAFFSFSRLEGDASRLIKFKVRRLIFEEIVRMVEFPNFKGARLLGFCLNVMGFSEQKMAHTRDSRALHRIVLQWFENHYSDLVDRNHLVAEACLVDGITYDGDNSRLVKTSQPNAFRSEPHHTYLSLRLRQSRQEHRSRDGDLKA